jgi:hypothetical protein
MAPFKLAVRVGCHIFRSEGEEAMVQRNFDRFMHLMEQVQSTQRAAAISREHDERDEDDRFHQRVYRLTSDGTVSLRHLPTTRDRQFDALVLLLYGYICAKAHFTTVFKNEGTTSGGDEDDPTWDYSVTSAELLAGMKRSGLECDRADRVLSNRSEPYVLQIGRKRGTRYALTKAGRDYAVRLRTDMLEKVPDWKPQVGDVCFYHPPADHGEQDGDAQVPTRHEPTHSR